VSPRSTKAQAAAVTGAGGGLGREVALKLAAKGYRVVGTALQPEEISELEQASGGAVTLTVCDITDETAVETWVQSASAALDEGGLDVLVSNAGILTPGPLEVLALDEIRREFEVASGSGRERVAADACCA
jgi:NAD(P)-dependent dehydrogenase (short-subunit alcohol dehydrogenase family)